MGYLIALLLAVRAASAAAADAQEFADTMLAIPVIAWAIAFGAGLLGGVISIISKLAKVPPAIDLRPLTVSISLMWSLVAGALGFLASLALNLAAPAIPIVVFACAVTGKPVIDWATTWVKGRADAQSPPGS